MKRCVLVPVLVPVPVPESTWHARYSHNNPSVSHRSNPTFAKSPFAPGTCITLRTFHRWLCRLIAR